jgi:hypothetical protein
MQSLPSHKRNKGVTLNVATQTVPGWKHAPKTGSSLQEGKAWVYQPPESGSVQKHARHLASFFALGEHLPVGLQLRRSKRISVIYTSPVRQAESGRAQGLDTRTLVRVVQDNLR